jgi:hypothetical protein
MEAEKKESSSNQKETEFPNKDGIEDLRKYNPGRKGFEGVR